MVTWKEFERADPELAEAGRSQLYAHEMGESAVTADETHPQEVASTKQRSLRMTSAESVV